MIYIGVDPGVSGGIAVLGPHGDVLHLGPMPGTERDVLDVFAVAGHGAARAEAMIERVWSSPQMGVASAFTFGRSYGALLMALTAEAIGFTEVLPTKWQTAMGCRTKGDKNVSKRRAQQLFPHEKITHATADALLLAAYCRTVFTVNHEDANGSKEAIAHHPV
jgi:Holliday junction resolvasome RuvABC endonuclease subunit